MVRTEHPAQLGMIDDGWQALDGLLEDLAAFSRQDFSEPEFYAGLFDRLAARLPVIAAAAWSHGREGQPHLQQRFEPTTANEHSHGNVQHAHPAMVQRVLDSGVATAIAPGDSADVAGPQHTGPGDRLLLLGPWKATAHVQGVLELVLPAQTDPHQTDSADPRSYLRLLEALCELVGDFQKNRLLRALDQRQQHLVRYDQFLLAVHRNVDLEATAYAMANEGRHFLGCDRLSVLVRDRTAYRLLAVSGLDRIAERSNVVRRLESLAEVVGEANEAVRNASQTSGLSPQTEERLALYLDVSHARDLIAVPLALPVGEAGGRPAARCVLVAERFHGVLDDAVRRRLEVILDHCATALGTAWKVERMPLRTLSQALQRALDFTGLATLSKATIALAAVAVAIAALAIFPADFAVEARGEIQPLHRRDVFAPSDAIVSKLAITDGSPVKVGQPLVVLRRPELDLEFKRVWGELQTARKRLGAIQAERLSTRRGSDQQRAAYDRLTAEEEEVTEVIGSLQKQHEVLLQQKAALTVRSPIAGKVLTWDVRQVLEGRPVGRGEALLIVADVEGPWQLILRIPDRRVSHVLRARQEADGPLGVSFILATSPDRQLFGRVKRLGERSQVDESGEAFVLATVEIDAREIAGPVPDASVLAKIDCGRRRIGYVWFHDAVDAVWRYLLF